MFHEIIAIRLCVIVIFSDVAMYDIYGLSGCRNSPGSTITEPFSPDIDERLPNVILHFDIHSAIYQTLMIDRRVRAKIDQFIGPLNSNAIIYFIFCMANFRDI